MPMAVMRGQKRPAQLPDSLPQWWLPVVWMLGPRNGLALAYVSLVDVV